jgi:hypothetical protein
VDVNVANKSNKSSLTALDVSDIILHMVGSGKPTDFILRDLLLRAGALRASEVEDVDTAQVYLRQFSLMAAPPPRTLIWQFLLNEILLLNPWRYWKMLANDVKKSPSPTQSALLVVAVLIATVTYQAVLKCLCRKVRICSGVVPTLFA